MKHPKYHYNHLARHDFIKEYVLLHEINFSVKDKIVKHLFNSFTERKKLKNLK